MYEQVEGIILLRVFKIPNPARIVREPLEEGIKEGINNRQSSAGRRISPVFPFFSPLVHPICYFFYIIRSSTECSFTWILYLYFSH